ncbi:hypothetical protein [Pseudoalteromonas rhizosphaerae]|uniref:hypothetical protein n=1 Tax=Pseudoalteromonas rhizosphaerae TaxID=2518973 RepID=UPI0021493E1F|nr:hypothetical protein [Pseudoalteromonas rhizosphaerae]
MENKFAWSFLGFLMALIFGGISLYLGFVKETKPDLNFVVTADSSVLDIKEKLGSLDVLYEGESLSKRKQDLRFITFKVINQGDSSILSNLYDINYPVGFTVINGELADDPKLLSASNTYLKEKLITTKKSNTSVSFSNVILEPNEFFEIKILVLHEVGKEPSIEAFGKIATINAIKVLRDFSPVNEQTFVEKTFGGGVYANVTRLITYGLIFIFGIIGLITVEEKVSDRREKIRKLKLVRTFKDYDSDKITEKDDMFFDYYMSNNARKLKDIHYIMSTPELLSDLSEDIEIGEKYDVYKPKGLFEELKSEGFIQIDNELVIVDEQRLSVLNDFINYLKRKGEFKRSRYIWDHDDSPIKVTGEVKVIGDGA